MQWVRIMMLTWLLSTTYFTMVTVYLHFDCINIKWHVHTKKLEFFGKLQKKIDHRKQKNLHEKQHPEMRPCVQAKSMLVLNYNRVITWVEQTGTSSYRSPYKSFICLQETVTKNQIRPTWDRSNSLITRKILLPPFFASCGFLCHSYQSHVESFRPVSCNHPYFTQNSCQDYYYDHSTIPDRRNYLRDPTTISWPVSFKISEDRLLLQRWLYYREHLKYVWNVYCVVTDHMRDLHTTATTGNEPFPIGHGTKINYFHFVLIISLFTSKQLLFLPICLAKNTSLSDFEIHCKADVPGERTPRFSARISKFQIFCTGNDRKG